MWFTVGRSSWGLRPEHLHPKAISLFYGTRWPYLFYCPGANIALFCPVLIANLTFPHSHPSPIVTEKLVTLQPHNRFLMSCRLLVLFPFDIGHLRRCDLVDARQSSLFMFDHLRDGFL